MLAPQNGFAPPISILSNPEDQVCTLDKRDSSAID